MCITWFEGLGIGIVVSYAYFWQPKSPRIDWKSKNETWQEFRIRLSNSNSTFKMVESGDYANYISEGFDAETASKLTIINNIPLITLDAQL